MKLKPYAVLFASVILLCSSCTAYKDVPYLQDLNQNTITKEEINNYSPLVIEPGDILGIHESSLNPEADAVFNNNLNRINGDNIDRTPQNAVIGFLVDAKGNIRLPYIGEMKVAGYNTTELTDILQTKLQTYLSKPIVNIRVLNFKVSVIGDVARPDVYTITNERVTIPEALALAGDLNVTAIRNNIILIREIDGKREFIPIDMTSKKLFESPYYYLKNNDVLYATPNRAKVAAASTSFQKVSLVIAALSVIAIVVSNSNFKL
ncbi:MAG: polysaccharide biosynthesis/export family protein [Bacteroidetes bacterium]|nr:polysaccharide biosynthesis/export family protein [Bacteroidota bacterium]